MDPLSLNSTSVQEEESDLIDPIFHDIGLAMPLSAVRPFRKASVRKVTSRKTPWIATVPGFKIGRFTFPFFSRPGVLILLLPRSRVATISSISSGPVINSSRTEAAGITKLQRIIVAFDLPKGVYRLDGLTDLHISTDHIASLSLNAFSSLPQLKILYPVSKPESVFRNSSGTFSKQQKGTTSNWFFY